MGSSTRANAAATSGLTKAADRRVVRATAVQSPAGEMAAAGWDEGGAVEGGSAMIATKCGASNPLSSSLAAAPAPPAVRATAMSVAAPVAGSA